jgi:hypothetical protein
MAKKKTLPCKQGGIRHRSTGELGGPGGRESDEETKGKQTGSAGTALNAERRLDFCVVD